MNGSIGIIGGTGWLGRAIATALVDTGFVGAESLTLSSRAGQLSEPKGVLDGVQVTDDNQRLVLRSDVVILSVRPQDLGGVHINVGERLLISLVAGVSLRDIEALTGARRVVRAMPNAALEIRKSYTPWLANAEVDGAGKTYVQQLFETCGEADEITSEQDLNYLTGLAGTGPSYPALLARALYNCAIEYGLPASVAGRAVHGVVVDASQLIGEQRGFDALLNTLIGYRGVSAAGIEGMQAGGLEASVKAGLDRAMSVASSNLSAPAEMATVGASQAVIAFWKQAGPKRWFKKDEAFDNAFRDTFQAAHFQAARGELEHWLATPQGALALLLLLDQYPRNTFRGTAHMFATDPLARAYARRMVEAGMDRLIEPSLRAFCYLPFEHSECMEDQQLSLALNKDLDANTYKWAKEHADIIDRFGRFPHRNDVMGRVSTDEERAFLEAGGFAG